MNLNQILFATETATETTTEAGVNITTSDVVEYLLDKAVEWCSTTGIKILLSLAIIVITFAIINSVTKRISKYLTHRNADKTLSKVAVSAIRLTLKILVLICIVGYLGFETASLSAVVASLGVGISLAVQGTLSNFAGGVIIIIMRPVKIGDFVTSNGQSGTVEDIKLFYTHLVTPDNRVIFIPNGILANDVIVNNSVKDTRRVDVIMSVSYSSNVKLAKELITNVCAQNELIFTNPAPFVEVTNYGDSSIDIVCRVWVKSSDYWDVNFYLLNEIKAEFDKNGIEIPFNQLDVNVKNSSN